MHTRTPTACIYVPMYAIHMHVCIHVHRLHESTYAPNSGDYTNVCNTCICMYIVRIRVYGCIRVYVCIDALNSDPYTNVCNTCICIHTVHVCIRVYLYMPYMCVCVCVCVC